MVFVAVGGRTQDAIGAEEEDELAEFPLVGRELLRVEAFAGEGVEAFVVEADFAEIGDEIPVDVELDGVLERLIDGGVGAAGEGSIERIARAFAFDGGDERGGLAGAEST